jgi:hypothetical protein
MFEEKKIYKRLNQAQEISLNNYNQLNWLEPIYDLIAHHKDLLYYFNDLTTLEKEQINEFSIQALKTVKSYKNMLDNTLV